MIINKIKIKYRAKVTNENFKFFKDGYYVIIDGKEPQKIEYNLFEANIELEGDYFTLFDIIEYIRGQLAGTPFLDPASINIQTIKIINNDTTK